MRNKIARQLIAAALVAVIVSCSDDIIIDPTEQTYSIADTSPVAGSQLQISSAVFAQLNSPTVTIGITALAVTRLNDTTLLAALPPTARGNYTVEVNNHAIGQIDVAGFVSRSHLATPTVGRGYRTSVNGHLAWILGAPDRDVVRLFPALGTIETLLENYLITVSDVRGAGATPQQDVVLLSPYRADLADPWNQPMEVWRLDPLEPIDTIPIVNTRVAALFNDSVLFKGTHHLASIYHLRAGEWQLGLMSPYEETYDVVLSPRGDRATILINWTPSTTGVPVFNMITGDSAFHVAPLRNTKGAHFSAAGDTLYLIGQTSVGATPSAVIAVSAATGAELMRFEVADWIVDTAYDPDANTLYLLSVAAYSGNTDTPEIYVLDASSLELRGLMRATVAGAQGCDYPNMIAGTEGVYYLCNQRVWRFDLVD